MGWVMDREHCFVIQSAAPMARKDQFWKMQVTSCPSDQRLCVKITGSSDRGDGILIANYSDPVFRGMWKDTITINLDGLNGCLDTKREIYWQIVDAGEASGYDVQVWSSVHCTLCHCTPCHKC